MPGITHTLCWNKEWNDNGHKTLTRQSANVFSFFLFLQWNVSNTVDWLSLNKQVSIYYAKHRNQCVAGLWIVLSMRAWRWFIHSFCIRDPYVWQFVRLTCLVSVCLSRSIWVDTRQSQHGRNSMIQQFVRVAARFSIFHYSFTILSEVIQCFVHNSGVNLNLKSTFVPMVAAPNSLHW